jgi:alpha-glucoside transport system permease protein
VPRERRALIAWIEEGGADAPSGTMTALPRGEPTTRALLLPAGAILGFVGILFGLAFMADQQASANVAAFLYDLFGNSGEAAALRAGGGDRTLAKLIVGGLALLIGVGGIWLVYAGLNVLVELTGPRWSRRLIPWVFIGPAVVLLSIYLVLPAVLTFWSSLTENGGLANWEWALTTPAMHALYRNNVVWLVVGTLGSVGLGLLIAGLVDRVKYESFAKTFVFLPLAISLVGASVIWRFVYAWAPPGQPQYGLLNALWSSLGFEPVPWMQTAPINTYLMIVILIWLQTGFAMVVLSAAIKGVPVEITEAARLDGASERQLFVRVIVPMIKGSVLTVSITTAIVVLKIFDIVFVMTGGRFDTDVIANQMFLQKFQFFNDGRASVLAVILFVAVLPLMVLNIRQMRRQGIR